MTNTTEAKAPCPLAVMESAVNRLSTNEESHCANRLDEARAKVAELVQEGRFASSLLHSLIDAWVPPEHQQAFHRDYGRFDAALAAFSGVR